MERKELRAIEVALNTSKYITRGLMNMKKTLLKTVSISLVTMMMLASCSEEKKESGASQVRIWTGDTGSRAYFETVVDEFNKTTGKENGIEVIYEAKENLGDAMTIALETNQAPEMFMTGDVAEYSEQGYIVAIDDLPGGKELVEAKKDFLIEGKQMYNGKTYSIPFAAQTYGLIYNKDMFKEAGIVDENGEAKPPVTYEEVREYAKKMTDLKNNKFGIVLPLKWGAWFGVDVMTCGSVNAGHIGYDYTTGEYDHSYLKPAMEMVMGIKEDKSYMPGAEGLDNDPARARFAEGNIGMKFGVSWDVGVLNDQFPAKCDWGVAPLPVADINDAYCQKLDINTGLKISQNGIDNVGAEKVMLVYNWFVSDETSKKLYELGANIPLNADVIASADTSKFKKGWAEFAAMVDISKVYPATPATDITGETDITANFMNNVWTGKMSIDDAVANENKIRTEGLKKYKELHPEYDSEKFIIPDWDCKIK